MGRSRPVLSLYDHPLWQSAHDHALKLQCCSDCQTFRYPPSPVCHVCLSTSDEWRPISGQGTILSWVIFHRQYFDDYPVPYNVVAVALDEGPIFTTTLVGATPQGSWIGSRVAMTYREQDDRTLPVVELA